MIRVDRISDTPYVVDILARGKRSIALDLKSKEGLEVVKKLICAADVVIDPFRPGVLEKLGLGPSVFLKEPGINPRLIYGRIVGQVISVALFSCAG